MKLGCLAVAAAAFVGLVVIGALNPDRATRSTAAAPVPSPSSAPVPSPSSAPVADADSGDDQVLTPFMRAAIARYREAAAADAPLLADCSAAFLKSACEGAQIEFVINAWPKAHKDGSIDHLRYVRDCLAGECMGAVVPAPVEGCAWAWVVLSMGDKRADHDAAAARRDCQSLDVYQLAAAKARAGTLLEELPAPPRHSR